MNNINLNQNVNDWWRFDLQKKLQSVLIRLRQ